MLASYATGLTAVVVLSLAWVGVQHAWRRIHPDASGDPDSLAGRLGCRGCGCTDTCEQRPPDPSGPAEEERP